MPSIKRADHDLYNTKEPIVFANGSKLSRYNDNVGLNIDSWVTVQRNYTSDIIPFNEFIEAQKALDKSYPLFPFECVSYSKSMQKIKFENCPYFDAHELPDIVSYVIYDLKTKDIEFVNLETTQMIQSKWLLVKDDYTGFNVQEAYEKSRRMYENS
jgi:hypothetical protein